MSKIFFILLITLNSVSLFGYPPDEESFEEEPSYVDPNDESFYLDEDEEKEPVDSSSASSSSSFSTPTKQISRTSKKNTPNGKGCIWRNFFQLTPEARNGGNIIYILTHERRNYRSQDLQSRFLTDEEIVNAVTEIAEYLILETNLFESGRRTRRAVYVGQTRDANVRGGQHASDLVNGAPVRKAEVLGHDREVFQQNLLRHVHPDQLDLFEDLFIIIMNANDSYGANSKGPKSSSKSFYSKYFRSKIVEIKNKALSLVLEEKTESCSETTLKRKDRDDDFDDRILKKPTLGMLGIKTNLLSSFASIH